MVGQPVFHITRIHELPEQGNCPAYGTVSEKCSKANQFQFVQEQEQQGSTGSNSSGGGKPEKSRGSAPYTKGKKQQQPQHRAYGTTIKKTVLSEPDSDRLYEGSNG